VAEAAIRAAGARRWTVAEIPDLSGRTAVVTGASAGIGLETARVLGGHGASVVLACRNIEKAERAAARRAGVRHTPSLVLGGRLYTGTKSFDELSSLIDRELMPGVLGRISP